MAEPHADHIQTMHMNLILPGFFSPLITDIRKLNVFFFIPNLKLNRCWTLKNKMPIKMTKFLVIHYNEMISPAELLLQECI